MKIKQPTVGPKRTHSKENAQVSEQPKHTQGEWRRVKDAFSIEKILSEDRLLIAEINMQKVSPTGESEAQANCERIVKAVNLLSIIENYMETHGYLINNIQDRKLEFLCALLKKAEQK